jgi:hypothetical protein
MQRPAETPPLQAFTARFLNPNIAKSRLVPISISRYFPRFRLPYRIEGSLLEVAPTADMLARSKSGALTLDGFAREYEAQLVTAGVTRILDRLARLQGVASGVVLLCYEDVTAGQSCHRTMLAEWLRREGNLTVVELPDPGKQRPAKQAPPESADEFALRSSNGATDPVIVDAKAVRTERGTPLDLPRFAAPLEAEVIRLLVRWAVAILRPAHELKQGPR